MDEESNQQKECEECQYEHHWHSVNTSEYHMEYCPYCDRIKKFRWKSFLRRLKDLLK